MLSLSPWSIKLLRFENWNFPRVKKIAKCKHHLLHVSFFLILTRALEHVVCLGESRLSQVNNSPRANVFPAGVANFGKAMYRSLERSTQDTRDGFFFCAVPRPYFLGRALIWPGYFGEHILIYSRPFWITSFGFVKVCGIRFSIWESFIGFYICCYPITTILACLFSVGVRISWKKKLRWSNKDNDNYRISFIDLYLVFPRNFRIVIFPHTTRTVLWYYHRAWVTCAEIYKKALEVQILNEVELRQVLRKRVSFQDRKNKNTPKFPSIKIWYKQHSDATQE